MPMVELSDADVDLLESIRKAGGASAVDLAFKAKDLHDKLYTHKDTARDYQKAIKVVLPNARVAADVAEPFVAEFREGLGKIDAFLAERAKEKEDADKESSQRTFNDRWASAVKDHELTAEGEEKLAEFMKKRQVADPEAAALLYFKQNPKDPTPIEPSSIAPQNWSRDMGLIRDEDDKSMKRLWENPQAWEAEEAAAVMNEVRRNAA